MYMRACMNRAVFLRPADTLTTLHRTLSGSDVLLDFSSFGTECTFDIVYVYDGAASDSPVLFVGSGSTLPSQLIAFSGTVRLCICAPTRRFVLLMLHDLVNLVASTRRHFVR
jgi:hypothetical protein